MAGQVVPGPVDLRAPALQWAAARRGGYLSADLKEHLAARFELTPDELGISEEGIPVFSNNVDWVTAHFTETGIHTSIDGRPHRRPDDRYYLTRYGYAVAEGKALWPTKQRHGPRGALPDPRQLPSDEGGGGADG
jgi:hypothetical protein